MDFLWKREMVNNMLVNNNLMAACTYGPNTPKCIDMSCNTFCYCHRMYIFKFMHIFYYYFNALLAIAMLNWTYFIN